MLATELYAAVAAVPEGVLKAIGTAAGAAGAAGFYLWGRLRRLPTPPETQVPRVALSETDRELGFTVIRTGTDLTRALHDHASALARAFPAAADGASPPPAPPRRARSRRT